MGQSLKSGRVSVAKSKSIPFPTAVACWVDLLGYGGMISAAGFNPLHPQSFSARNRLWNYHTLVASHSMTYFPTLALNDGVIAYRDLSYRSASVTYDFLSRCWNLFKAINAHEKASGFPGARMVVAAGFRVKGSRRGYDSTAGQFRSLMERWRSGDLDAKQALDEARRIRPYSDILPQLQANYAFTKAYCAEKSGKAGGLGGAHCFVDLALLEEGKCEGMEFGPAVNWKDPNLDLQANFAPLLNLRPYSGTNGAPKGLRTGLEVAQHLAGDQDVLKALYASSK
jgi:hypothetical protein